MADWNDFRSYLEYLEKGGALLRVGKEVDTRFDIAAGIRKTSDINGPALLFENVKGYPGWKVAAGVYATRKLMALALGLPPDASDAQMMEYYLDFTQKRIKPEPVTTGPVKKVIIKGEDIDLSKIPVATYSAADAGPYLTAGVEIARHPDTGKQNVSVHRRMLLDKSRTSLSIGAGQDLYRMVMAAERSGHGLGVATVVGVDPALTIASQISAPFGVDETEIAGAIKGEPVKMVKCETIDVDVPANAEMVIEGVTVPSERIQDGPFAEYPGNYITMRGEPTVPAFVVKVTAVTMRENPVFHAMLTGMPSTENHYLKRWALMALAYQKAGELAGVKAVNVTPGSGHSHHFIVSIVKTNEREPRNIILSLLASRIMARQITVVDDDIDVFNPDEVEWAIATRILPDKDVLILPAVSRGPEPPTVPERMSARWGIDATAPLKGKQWYRKARVPNVENVDYI